MTIAETCRLAGQHAGAAAFSSEEEKNTMLARAADALVARSEEILAANGAGDDDFAWFGGTAKRHYMRPDTWVLYTPDKL